MSEEHSAEKDAPIVENHHCFTCASYQCDHAHASYLNPDGYERGCLGCLMDEHEHSCGFVDYYTAPLPPGGSDA